MEEEQDARKIRQRFLTNCEINGYLNEQTRALLAVSGGVDSMVLLDLMMEAQKKWGFFLAVTHINHQLREESVHEVAYLKKYCQQHQLPLQVEVWEKPTKKGIETAAREFRYQVFAKQMQSGSYDCLMTAHHGDDQMETVLMKLLRGGQLSTYAGIKEAQPFSNGRLIRPLVGFSKAQLYQYASERELVYFEDHTNQELDVQRNRLRHLVLPQLKQENPQAMVHFQRFSQQIQWADRLIQTHMKKVLMENVVEENERVHFPWKLLAEMPEEENYYFLYAFFDHFFEKTAIVIKEKQIQLILQQCQQKKGQWKITLERGWVLQRSYEKIYLIQEKADPSKTIQERTEAHKLELNQRIRLDESCWIGLFTPEAAEEARKADDWDEFSHDLWLSSHQELFVGKRQAGERIQLNSKLKKKISRYLIDNKVPDSQRKEAWVVRDQNENIYSLVPFTYSYLSIGVETDKIHYILLYKYHKEAIGRRT
ncbi:tRNA lysidine(34) synthetase TilS [Enterococcus hirae]